MVELDHFSNLQNQFSCNFSNKYLVAIKKINEQNPCKLEIKCIK